MKILVVEDDPLIVRTLGELLEAEGYEVATTAARTRRPRFWRNPPSTFSYSTSPLHREMALQSAPPPVRRIRTCRSSSSRHPTTSTRPLPDSTWGRSITSAKPFRARELLSRMRVALRQNSSGAGHAAHRKPMP